MARQRYRRRRQSRIGGVARLHCGATQFHPATFAIRVERDLRRPRDARLLGDGAACRRCAVYNRRSHAFALLFDAVSHPLSAYAHRPLRLCVSCKFRLSANC